MRKLHLTKSGLNKLKSHHKELRSSDLDESIRSFRPGEWCCFCPSQGQEAWFGYLNPMISEKFSCAHVLGPLVLSEVENFDPAAYIVAKLKAALGRRTRFKGYIESCRLFYGTSDGLPGLIIDRYENACLIQINTAGIDSHRELIQSTMNELTGIPSYFLDNPKYREKEFLPTHATTSFPALKINENGVRFELRPDVTQKVGFYFDHRENRQQLLSLLGRLQGSFINGLDLFCYSGAWGIYALKGGLEKVDFVDQGEFSEEIEVSLKQNGLKGKGQFHRSDVFKFLEAALVKNMMYDVILCDPPAFAKSAIQKSQALEGYSRLHRRVLKVAAPGALCVFSSCTHYVSHDEFQKNVLDAALREGKALQLLYTGIQGWDHPVMSLNEKSNYIKSYFYLLE